MDHLPHPELQRVRKSLLEIHDSISTFTPLRARPPIIDSSYDAGNDGEDNQWLQQEIVPGLKKLKENVKLDLGVLEKFLDDPNCDKLPALSTNAPYLIAVWNEAICAPPPIVSVFKTFPLDPSSACRAEKQKQKEKARSGVGENHSANVKVDVVADNGRHWIRVNTIKNSRIISEFREIDSYLTDSSDDSSDEWDDTERPSLAQTEFDNSVLRMGRQLVKAAQANPIEGTDEIPKITLRLTRLDPTLLNEDGSLPDSRIAKTLECLEEMGINVALGERTDTELAQVSIPSSKDSFPENKPFIPTSNINLDLSGLIALISDLTHAEIPQTLQEANKRFVPPQEYREWKQKRYDEKRKTDLNDTASQPTLQEPLGMETDINDLPRDLIKHARALTNQLLQEMGRGLLQELHEKLGLSSTSSSSSSSSSSLPENDKQQVIFWTTSEARDRCLRIVSKIGGIHEKRRARALFCLSPDDAENQTEIPLEEAQKLYWQDSRFPSQFIPFLPIRIFPPVSPDTVVLGSVEDSEMRKSPQSSFSKSLAKICADILSQETIPHRRALSRTADNNQSSTDIQRATVTKANPRLTAHTVQSMQWGAELGWTVLTANRTSVKAILRELKTAKVAGRLAGVGEGDVEAEREGRAAIWIIDPRSLAEGMSSLPVART